MNDELEAFITAWIGPLDRHQRASLWSGYACDLAAAIRSRWCLCHCPIASEHGVVGYASDKQPEPGPTPADEEKP